MLQGKKDLVFISCGQYCDEEIKLGKELADAVNELTNFEGYFAQNQTSLDGVSQHILGALNRCAGFVGIMHHRGVVETPDRRFKRASVWVEQELAIAAFIQQAQQRQLATVVYTQKGIHREGVREQLLLGAVEFDTESEVLTDFRRRLGDGHFRPVSMVSPKDVAVDLGFQTISRGNGTVHQYRLCVKITNVGDERLDDYWIELQFPKGVSNNATFWGIVPSRRTDTHIFLRQTRADMGRDLFPGDTIDAMTIDYHMDSGLFHDGSVLDLPVVANIGAPGMQSKRVEKPFRQLQEF
jgi:hypothetical protein